MDAPQKTPGARRAVKLTRATRETSVSVYLNVDGTGSSEVTSGFPFLDHFLETLALHASLDLELAVESERPDLHHSAEDVGWALGTALRQCLGHPAECPEIGNSCEPVPGRTLPVRRFGWAAIPFDEVLILVSVDLIGRPGFYLSPGDGLDHCDIQEFFKAFTGGLGATLHIQVLRDGNLHHKIECSSKALGRALREAVAPDDRLREISVKGKVTYQS
ncbi:MAG: imidazoleglycerol-phosphate dehydratase [Bacillota bacterium]